MQAYIVTTFIGCFGVDERNKIIGFKPFPKTPEQVADKLRLAELEVIDEEKQLMYDLYKKHFKEFIFSVRKPGVKHAEPGNKSEEYVKQNLRKLAIDYKIVRDQAEFNNLLTQINLELTKSKIKKAVERDRLIVQANGAVEELDKSINILVERLREWYGLHFPEMDRIVLDHEKFARIIEKFGSRQKIRDPKLDAFIEKSMGADLIEDDIKTLQIFSVNILELYKLREDLMNYIDRTLREVAPNLRELAGPSLAAKLISKAGSLEKLVKMPSSTIQLLGAEKALFRYLHGHGKSPKYGILYSHQLVQNSPKDVAGKIARILASKMTIAMRIDYYSKKYKADQMKKELNQKINEIIKNSKAG